MKKRILRDSKEILARKKYGSVPIYNTISEIDNDDDDRFDAPQCTSKSIPISRPKKPDRSQSMRVNVVRKQHLQQTATSPFSPIAHVEGESNAQKPISSTPAPRSILKPSNTASVKRVV